MDELHRKRLQSMLAVDDMIGDLIKSLHESGELDNTYIFFTSDNGFTWASTAWAPASGRPTRRTSGCP